MGKDDELKIILYYLFVHFILFILQRKFLFIRSSPYLLGLTKHEGNTCKYPASVRPVIVRHIQLHQ